MFDRTGPVLNRPSKTAYQFKAARGSAISIAPRRVVNLNTGFQRAFLISAEPANRATPVQNFPSGHPAPTGRVQFSFDSQPAVQFSFSPSLILHP